MARYRTITPVLLIAAIMTMGGCALLQKPLDPAVIAAVEEAEQIRDEMAGRIETMENTISGLEYSPNMTPAESAVLDDTRGALETLNSWMVEADAWLDKTNKTISDSATNEDAILGVLATLSDYLPIPFVGLGVGLWRSMRKNGDLKTAIINVEGNKNDQGYVDWKGVKSDNLEVAGLNSYLRKIRKNGAG